MVTLPITSLFTNPESEKSNDPAPGEATTVFGALYKLIAYIFNTAAVILAVKVGVVNE